MRPRWPLAVLAAVVLAAVIALVVWLLLLRGAGRPSPTVTTAATTSTPTATRSSARPSTAPPSPTATPTPTASASVATLAPSETPTPSAAPTPTVITVPGPTVTVTATVTAQPSTPAPPWLAAGSCARLAGATLTSASCGEPPASGQLTYAVATAGSDGADCPSSAYVRYETGQSYACLIPQLKAGTCYGPDKTVAADGALKMVTCNDATARFRYVSGSVGSSSGVCATGQTALVYVAPAPGLVYCTQPPR